MSPSDDAETRFLRALDAHRGILASVAAAYCRDRGSRDDVMQSIVAELWRAYPRYDARARFSTWMYRIAVNTAISWYRRARRSAAHDSVDPAAFEALPADAAAASDPRREQLDTLLDALDEFSRALVLLYLDGGSYAEIAAITGLTETNVATKLSRIKERLRKEHARGTR